MKMTLLDDVWTNRVLLVTGGTGSFGTKMIERMLQTDISEIRVFSRDENKQESMRKSFKDPRIRFFLGDVRDERAIDNAVRGANFVFHAAALKQVPSCEFFPIEATKTNVMGTSNVLNSSVTHEVESVVCLSTDKAVYPINAMGQSKALMEKVARAVARSYEDSGTRISITRYGNVVASRGSVVPLFIEQARAGRDLTVTHEEMTRFIMSLEESVNLVLHALVHGQQGEIFVHKAPSATVGDLAKAIMMLVPNGRSCRIVTVGLRHGEKMHETLISDEEMVVCRDSGLFFSIPADNRSLNYQTEEAPSHSGSVHRGFTSENTRRLEVEEIKALFCSVPEVQQLLK